MYCKMQYFSGPVKVLSVSILMSSLMDKLENDGLLSTRVTINRNTVSILCDFSCQAQYKSKHYIMNPVINLEIETCLYL